jgi:selenocysteine lyase/cysteine desulfurase
MELVEDLLEQCRAAGLAPRVAPHPARRSGIVTLPSVEPGRDVRRLAAAGVIADARPGCVRVSPFFYNERDDLRALVELIKP